MSFLKTIAITGASSGFGKATAKILSSQGYELILLARRKKLLDELISELPNKATAFELDVRDSKACNTILKNQPIDVLINNAGLALNLTSFESMSFDDVNTMIETNIQGLLYCTHAVLPHMIAKNKGYIFNIGSVAARFAYEGGNVYGATKAFVHQFSENLRTDLFGKKIRITTIAPGLANTDFSKVRFKGNKEKADKVYENTEPLVAEDIANSILYCLQTPPHVNITFLEVMATYQVSAGLKVFRDPSLV